MSPIPAVLVHGGAGPMTRLHGEEERAFRRGLEEAARAGLLVLERGGTALDAVETANKVMEASGAFNAGAGACLDEEGRATLDAALMRGEDLAAGAVGATQATVHPVSLARALLDEGRHVLLVGEGADRRARALGLPPLPPVDAGRRRTFERLSADRKNTGRDSAERLAATSGVERPDLGHDTVGAVAVDAKGRVAAGVSTGGLWLKAPFRVGDSALPGSGLYACDLLGGAAVATGIGERILKVTLTREACDRIARGAPADVAAREAIAVATARFGKDTAGVIVCDREGRLGAAFDTAGMGRAFARADGRAAVAVWPHEPFLPGA